MGAGGSAGSLAAMGAVGTVVPMQTVYMSPGGYVSMPYCPPQEGMMMYPEAVPIGGMGYSVPVQAMKRMGSSSVGEERVN